jgi:uncharacterized membrane protein YraQ (UPF0718 family)
MPDLDRAKGLTAISHFFVMDWSSLWMDIVAGLVIAGALAAWVPKNFWQAFFLHGHPLLSKLWGPLIGLLHLIPRQHSTRVMEKFLRWNYTTWLNIAFTVLAIALAWRFLRTGGPEML